MRDNRVAKRLQQQNKVTITVVSGLRQPVPKGISYNLTQDISASGAKLRSNTFLPKDAILKIELTLSDPLRVIRVLGKVQWVKSLFADELFEVGVAFVDTAADSIRVLREHIEGVGSQQG